MTLEASLDDAREEQSAARAISSLTLFSVVALAPLPFGSTDPVFVACWCLAMGVALCAASFHLPRGRRLIPLIWLGVLFLASGIVVAVQLGALPGFTSNPVVWSQARSMLADALLEAAPATVRNQPVYASGAWLLAASTFATSYIICSDRRRVRQLFQVVAWSGFVYALLGIVLFLLDPSRLLWREKTAYLSSVTGPFVNRNTAAVYFGTCAIIALLLLLQKLRAHRYEVYDLLKGRQASLNSKARGSRALLKIAVPLLLFSITLTALLMTGSRAGVAFSFAGLVVAGTSFAAKRGASSVTTKVLYTLIGCAAALAVLQIFGGLIGSRFDEHGLSDLGRWQTYKALLPLIEENPWWGSGLGTFPWAFPPFRSSAGAVWGVWDKAHNTLLELVAEVGIPLGIFIALSWLALLGKLLSGVRHRRRGFWIPLGAFAAGLVVTFHSLIDFSLQIPGFAVVIFALLGGGIAQSFSTKRIEVNGRTASSPTERRWTRV